MHSALQNAEKQRARTQKRVKTVGDQGRYREHVQHALHSGHVACLLTLCYLLCWQHWLQSVLVSGYLVFISPHEVQLSYILGGETNICQQQCPSNVTSYASLALFYVQKGFFKIIFPCMFLQRKNNTCKHEFRTFQIVQCCLCFYMYGTFKLSCSTKQSLK